MNFNFNSNSPDKISNLAKQAVPNTNLVDGTINNEGNLGKPNNVLNTHIEIMKNSLRTISGSVQFPGAYPVAKTIRLSNFLSTAGLIEHTAKSVVKITEAINQKDRLVKGNPRTVNLNDANLNKVELSGLYYLDIPLAINDAINKSVKEEE